MRTFIVAAAALCVVAGGAYAAQEKASEPRPAEMNRQFEKARTAFERHDMKTAATDIRSGQAIVKQEADRAMGEDKDKLVAASGDLNQLATEVEAGKVTSVGRLNMEFARAQNRLADHYQKLASESWEKKDQNAATRAYETSKDYFTSAAKWTGEKAEDLYHGAKNVTGDAISSLGDGVKKLGEKLDVTGRDEATATRGDTH